MAKLGKVPQTDLEYVEFYSNRIRENSNLFDKQRILINSQLKASKSLFSNIFGKEKNFKEKARKFLKERGFGL